MAKEEKPEAKAARLPHAMPVEDAMKAFGTSSAGLDEEGAASLLSKYGPNNFFKPKPVEWPKILLRQFENLLILMLVAASLISFFIGGHEIDGIGIMVAVLLSVGFGFFQEYKAESALEALKRLTVPTASVMRGGKAMVVKAESLVPGDILIISEGDKVSADCRIFESANIHADQSSLTGESYPIRKETGALSQSTILADRSNTLYAGTVVTRGHGRAIVVGTGGATEFGKIAQTLQDTEEETTPLQKNLGELGKKIGIAALFLCLVYFAFGVMRGVPAADMFIIAVSLAVAAIPEGLPTILAITLAIGVQKMAKRNALIRRLPAVETLGSATFICTDKTGTLTENKQTVTKLCTASCMFSFSGAGFGTGQIRAESKSATADACSRLLSKSLEICCLCNNANITAEGGEVKGATGDPTEIALLVAAWKDDAQIDKLRSSNPIAFEITFDSGRKMMSVVRAGKEGTFAYVKGAPEKVLMHSTHILTERGEEVLTSKRRAELTEQLDKFSSQALRVLGLAYKKVKHATDYSEDELERGMVFAGLIGMIDPPRPEALPAVQLCKSAGIKVMMITGDSGKTAEAIARQVGILSQNGLMISGERLDGMKEAELRTLAPRIQLCYRATPEHKFRIISALMENGEIVAVTGDGVNDAPAIKKANIGVAMGISGTDVSKEVADMVLTDDNFSSIVKAVKYGRTIMSNIKSFVRFQFSTNVAALTLMFAAPIMGMPLPLAPLQILFINIIMDGPPAIALGVEPPSRDEMAQKPRNPKIGFLSNPLLAAILFNGLLMAIITLFAFASYLASEPAKATSIAFTTFVFLQLGNALNCKSAKKSIFSGMQDFLSRKNPEAKLPALLSNKYLLLAILLSGLLQVLIVQMPYLQAAFHTVSLAPSDFTFPFGGALLIIALEEMKKRFFRGNTDY
jgi:Ca2+-transporting ATPase